MAADLILLYEPDVPPWVSIIATVIAVVAAVKFTGWYPPHERSNALPKATAMQ